jgi:hypothetical protein
MGLAGASARAGFDRASLRGMAREVAPETAVDRLVSYLFDGADAVSDPFAEELAGWLAASTRFRSFLESNRDKVRKKLRGAADTEARRDLRAELRAAHLLVANKGFEVAFEAYGLGKAGPDFTVTYRGERAFNLEVTRRRTADAAGYGWALLAKLRQLPPSVPNAVLIAIDGQADAADPEAAIRALRARADRKEEEFFVERGFDGSRGFYERFLRLSAVFVLGRDGTGTGTGRASVWINRSARIDLPPRAARACLLALDAS